MSSADLAKAVGHQFETRDVAWNKRDLLLYAIGIGATKDDLPFVYELDRNFAAFPTYPVVLPVKLNLTDVSDFRELMGSVRTVKGLPDFNPDKLVHGSQFIEIIKPIPLVSGTGWKLRRRLAGIHENSRGIVMDDETVLVSPQGEIYARMFSSAFNLGAKVYGTSFKKTIAAAPTAKPVPKNRKPSVVFTQHIPEEQAIIYRLSGDYSPLHVDPAIGISAGFGGPILHGLATFGFVARGILSKVGNNESTALRAFGARFTSPVKLGDDIETSVWEVGPGPDGTTEFVFQTKNLNSGKLCLGSGIATVKKMTEKSKL